MQGAELVRALHQAVVDGLRTLFPHGVVNIVEPTAGPWVNQNLYGDRRNEALPASEGVEVEVLPKNTKMYGPPHVHTVCLSRGDEAHTTNGDVRARVTFACGGVEQSFDCDWVHGAQFTLVANMVSVNAVSYAPFPFSPYNVDEGHVFLGASVAKGTHSNPRWPLTYTEPVTRFLEVGDAEFVVRDFARAVTVHKQQNNNPATVETFEIRFLDAPGGSPLAVYNGQVCAGGAQIPIPGGCQVVQVHNADAEGADMTVQWFLGL